VRKRLAVPGDKAVKMKAMALSTPTHVPFCPRRTWQSRHLHVGSRKAFRALHLESVSPRHHNGVHIQRSRRTEMSSTGADQLHKSKAPKILPRWEYNGSKWMISTAVTEELREVSAIQAVAFHEANPIEAMNKMFLSFFQAEVYDALLKKATFSEANRFACLVAKSREPDESAIIGVVELSIQAEPGVNKDLGTTEYLYICCMAVSPEKRRQAVATDLLAAGEALAVEWGHDRVCLHVHTTNVSAQTCYERAGYKIMSTEPAWSTSMIGRPRRVLMTKEL